MDLRKEIKFSDLLPKRGKKEPKAEAAPTEAKPAKEKRSLSLSRKQKEPRPPKERKTKERKPKTKTHAKGERKHMRHKKLVGLKVALRTWPRPASSTTVRPSSSRSPARRSSPASSSPASFVSRTRWPSR
jgi:hypothetical protein